MLAVIGITAASILAILLLLLLAVCLLPAKLTIRMENGNTDIKLSFVGIPLYRYPEKQQLQKRPQKAKKNNTAEGNKLLSLPNSHDPEAIFSFLKALLQELTSLFPHTKATLYRLSLIPPAAKEAAMAALWHTGASAGAAAFLELLDRNTILIINSRNAVSIYPNFTQEKAAFALHLTLSLRGYRALLALGSLGKRLAEIQN